MTIRTATVIAAAAAAMFAAGTIASVSHAQAGVKCTGINSCKGTSACKTASSSCKGMNACKGQGWVSAKDAAECTSKGGKVAS
ncbi:MAG: hypothetical protein KF889_13675 [Alphaproteobacteria bacterium]|nr:hypothetical protein [Alphaproteobacteria bacterium]MCW5738953.1 hypothetical protein [Alphaproteobacteria bacterium]